MADKIRNTNNSRNDTDHKVIIKKVVDELRPLLDEAVDVKVKQAVEPITTKLDSLQKTLSAEIKNIMSNIKQTPPVANSGLDINGIMSQLKDDPMFKQIAPMLGVGGASPQMPSMQMPPDFDKMSDEQKKWYQQQQSMMTLPMLLQALQPIFAPQSGGMIQELMMRKMMSDMAFAEHMNRGLMQFMAKSIFKDPTIADQFASASNAYMSPIADPAKYAVPQSPQQKPQVKPNESG